MATLVLTAAGTVFGGPLGGAIAALAGQAIDGRLLRPKGREGPRLADLAVATSSYGTAIPRLYGTLRVGGSVIWSTDLIERASGGGGGKSRGGTTYSYSASFATVLSARPILGVGRIWADGKLLRGAAGDLKAPGRLRVHLGGPDQAPDPLIASAEGARTPAMRGQAYAVFEDLALADFGNRIPSLTFEVIADPGPVGAGAILADASDGLIAAGEDDWAVRGYAAYGDSVRAVASGLAAASGGWLVPAGERFVTRRGSGGARELDGRSTRSIAAADGAAGHAIVAHYDPARDYQTGTQRAVRPGGGARVLRLDMPAAIDAGAAKTLAQDALARTDTARERRRLTLDWRALDVAPGDRVTIAGEAGLWRVTGWALEAMTLTLELERLTRQPIVQVASAGRVRSAPDRIAGRTILRAFEIPPIDDTILAAPRLTIAAAGTGPGWRGAALQLSLDGDRWQPIAAATREAVLGTVAEAPPPAPSTLVDTAGMIVVTLAREDMVLTDADDLALDGGANLALAGDELVQFARVERLAPRRWRLSGLWRGRRGTEGVAATRAGDRFVLLDPATLRTVDVPLAAVGARVSVLASGTGDGAAPVAATAAITGVSVAPPSPVHLARQDGALRWVRRSRAGWRWIDGVDAPLVEERERYTLTLADGALHEVGGAAVVWPTAGTVSLRQLGTLAASNPAYLTLA